MAEPDCQITLVGNKYDLIQDNPENRQVSMDEIKQIKKEYNLNYIETSACANIRVDEAFENLLESMIIIINKFFVCFNRSFSYLLNYRCL